LKKRVQDNHASTAIRMALEAFCIVAVCPFVPWSYTKMCQHVILQTAGGNFATFTTLVQLRSKVQRSKFTCGHLSTLGDIISPISGYPEHILRQLNHIYSLPVPGNTDDTVKVMSSMVKVTGNIFKTAVLQRRHSD